MRFADRWEPVEAYVDSGATYTVLSSQIAEGVGFPYRIGDVSRLQVGDGNFISIYIHRVDLQIGPVRFPAYVAFSDELGISFNLLGRESVFSRFTVCFQEQQGLLTFDWPD